MSKPSLLILSFYDISVDPRVLKQVRRFADEYDVTTCGPGPQPDPRVQHVELDVHFVPHRNRVQQLLDERAREREDFAWSYHRLPMVVQIRAALKGRRFDAAIANDADTVGIASEIVGAERVHADLHEFFPGLPQPDSELGRRQTRWWEWLVRAHCAPAASSTTVGREIARRYHEYGVRPGVVTNAAPRRELRVRPTGSPIRLVHSGNPFRDRGLGDIMRAVARSRTEVTLDLYLMKQNAVELAAVVELAGELGPRITVHDPVPQHSLIETLNDYDVGIHVLPPTSENNALALPNKFFDFVQARLGIIVGPSLEMARIVEEHGLGWVTDSFDEDAIVRVLDGLTSQDVDERKRASDAAATALSAEAQVEVWADAVAAIVAGARSRILIASFTDLSRDPRAIKQVRAAVELGEVTTCSFGPAPHPDVEHISLDPAGAYRTGRLMQFVDTQARERDVFAWTYARIPYVRQARTALRGRRFDAAIADNADAARLVRRVVPRAALHVDLHEYFPGVVFDDGSVEARRQQRYLYWLHRTGVVGAGSTSVVAPLIAGLYQRRGIDPDVVTNAAPSQDMPVRPTGTPVRYVHSGNSQTGRGLRRMMRAIARADADVTLDLYLVPNDPVFHAELLELADALGDRIRIHDPVPQSDLVRTLNQHDVGIFVLPPTTRNSELALPNKFFDFVQARLGVLVGPSPEMARLVEAHELGRVTEGFGEDDIVRAVESFDAEQVDRAKHASDAAAAGLSGDGHHDYWVRTLQRLLSRARKGSS